MKIAIFIYERGLQVHHFNFAKGLADKGNDVSVFTHDAYEFCFKIKNFKYKNISVHKFNDSLSFKFKLQKRLLRLFSKLFNLNHDIDNSIISPKTLKRSARVVKNSGEFNLAVGFEKKGLIWAGMLFEKSTTKLVYYSLELYEDNHYSFINDITFPLVRKYEKHYHQKCSATIIQDAERCKFLYQINNINNQNALYLPVAVNKFTPLLIPEYLTKKINRHRDKIILSFGKVDEERKALDISKVFSKMHNNDYVLVFNGPGQKEYVSNLQKLSNSILCLSQSPEKYIDSIISNAYIGLVFYDYKSKNEELTVFASEKLAYYLKHKKPIIVFANSHYEKFLKEYKCGIAIKNINELWEAISTIDADYSLFQNEAALAYEKYYCFENGFSSIYKEIESIMSS